MEGASSILLVEDDAALRFVCRVTLELERFVVREAGRVDEARAALEAERPALVFLDVHLGSDDTDGLLEELNAAGVPVVVVSGTSDLDRYSSRAAATLGKPFDPSELVAAAHHHALG